MPVMDGLEATRHLRVDPATRNIPIIILAAHALRSDREAAMEFFSKRMRGRWRSHNAC